MKKISQCFTSTSPFLIYHQLNVNINISKYTTFHIIHTKDWRGQNIGYNILNRNYEIIKNDNLYTLINVDVIKLYEYLKNNKFIKNLKLRPMYVRDYAYGIPCWGFQNSDLGLVLIHI